MPRYYVKQRFEVEAFQVKSDGSEADWPEWAKSARAKPEDEIGAILFRPILPGYFIETFTGRLIVEPGDWIVRTSQGEITGMKNDAFQLTYEAASEE